MYYEKWAAERAAMRVSNVKAVASEIKVELPSSATRSDEDIARTAMNYLDWNYSVPGTVKVQVTNGWVTLKSTTEWQYQKEEAEGAVRPLKGVKRVFNDIVVTPILSATDVKLKIENALRRNAEIDADQVKVETSDGKVTLRDAVRSWAEREEAEHSAWATPGVTRIEDLLTISYKLGSRDGLSLRRSPLIAASRALLVLPLDIEVMRRTQGGGFAGFTGIAWGRRLS
ncbi:MAG: BON domain-containing protein [Bryobacteraceae bacterium]|jgi:osmotically-inducible protein OsmY